MKTVIYFIFTCLISTGALLGATNGTSTSYALYLVGFGIWGLFIWGVNNRSKKNNQTYFRESIIRDENRRAANRNF